MHWLILALLSQTAPGFVSCECLCVEGIPQTLCESVEQARNNTRFCPGDMRCPVPFDPPPESPLLDAPEGAHTCRDVRIWYEAERRFTGVKICDVSPA
jgi:hypothetical protein